MNNILFENDACMVINKLPGESSEVSDSEAPNVAADGGTPAPSAPGGEFPVPAHRLDVPVSGCLLLAKTQEAAAFLGRAFAQPGRIEKRYWAIVENGESGGNGRGGGLGESRLGQGEIVHWIGINRKANKSFATAAKERPGQKKAVLRCRLAGRGERYLFLEIDLVTGRHHQIRAQLAALGFCIKGDLKYGARRSEKGGGIRLHAHSLAFPNPLAPNETIRVNALPPAMDALWTAFAKAVSAAVTPAVTAD